MNSRPDPHPPLGAPTAPAADRITAAGSRAAAAAGRRGWLGDAAGRLAVAVAVAALLGGLPAGAAAAPAGGVPVDPLPAGAAVPVDATTASGSLRNRIRALEAEGRAQPSQAAAALDRLLPATSPSGPERLELLTVQGLLQAVASQPLRAEATAAQLAGWAGGAGQANTVLAHAAAQLVRAVNLRHGGELRKAAALLSEAVSHLPNDLDPLDRYRFVIERAYQMRETSKLEAAVQLGHEALALADRQPALWRRSEARTALARTFFAAKQREQAQRLADDSLALATQAGDWVSLGRAYNFVGVVADAFNDQATQRRAFEAAVMYARRAGSKQDEAHALANLADFFLETGDYRTALVTAERALVLNRELADRDNEALALANVGLAHVSLHHFDVGARYIHEAVALDERRGSVSGVADTWREFGRYLEKAGDAAGAVAAYHQHRRLATPLLRTDQQNAILEMQEQYDADGRSRALALLDRENDVKAAHLRRRHLQQRLWLVATAVCLLAAVVIGLLHRRLRLTNRLLSRRNSQLAEQSERDALTGLANRRHFDAAMRRLAHDGKLSGTVLLIDIDHFKRINDLHGHAAGDAVLVEVARRLTATLRDDDLLVRWGGEEFLVVMQNLDDTQVQGLTQRLLDALHHRPVVAAGRSIPVTGSIGFATFPIGPNALRVPWQRAVDLVDTAMYLAKSHGRNRAYGVGLPQAGDQASLDAVTRSLEAAWQDGRATLTRLHGSQAPAAAVAAVAA